MTSQKQQLNEQKMINHLSTVGILGNVILTAFKLLAFIIGCVCHIHCISRGKII